MRPDLVVVASPFLCQNLRLPQAVEDLTVQELIPELAVERLAVTVLPRTARLNEQGLCTHLL